MAEAVHIGDEEDKALRTTFNQAVITAASSAEECVFKLPNGRDAYCLLYSKYNCVGRWKIYSQVIQEGNQFYLQVTPPYVYGTYTNDSGDSKWTGLLLL